MHVRQPTPELDKALYAAQRAEIRLQKQARAAASGASGAVEHPNPMVIEQPQQVQEV